MRLDDLAAGDDGSLAFEASSMGRLVEVEGWVAGGGHQLEAARGWDQNTAYGVLLGASVGLSCPHRH